MRRINSLPLSPVVILHYATLQGKPLLTSLVQHCSTKLVPVGLFARCKKTYFGLHATSTRGATLCLNILNPLRKFARVSKFHSFPETKQTDEGLTLETSAFESLYGG